MLRLRGKPFGAGVALGTAGVMRAPFGIPVLPARLAAQMARTRRDEPVEPVEVILVAEDYDAAAGLTLPWARVVGIAAQRAGGGAERPGVPAVIGVERLLDSVGDDALLLIDGDRGIVLVEPEGTVLAAYQAERERIAPRRRLHLDYAHQPARTLDGRVARVIACVKTPEEAQAAVQNGADALHVPEDTVLLPAEASDEEQLEALRRLGEAAEGLPITLAGNAETVSIAALLRAAARAEFTLAVPLSRGTSGFAELREYIEETRGALLAEDLDFADFRLAGAVLLEGTIPDDLAGCMVERVVLEPVGREILKPGQARARLDDLMVETSRLLIPVEVLLPPSDDTALETALGLGAAGFIVAPDAVQAVKERLREMDAAVCRAALLGPQAG
jgi:hypothetical protein